MSRWKVSLSTYPLLVAVVLALLLVRQSAQSRETSRQLEEIWNGALTELAHIHGALSPGDSLPHGRLTTVSGSLVHDLPELGREYDLIYFFSVDCPACRSLDSSIATSPDSDRMVHVSIDGVEQTRAYVDSLGIGAQVASAVYDSLAELRIYAVPTLVLMTADSSGTRRVANVGVGVTAIRFLLSQSIHARRD